MISVGLFSLEQMNLGVNLIEVYKIMSTIDMVDSQKLVSITEVAIPGGYRVVMRGKEF